jgi:prepilin signal peptidase PulO-like enzyme (type II secretory pathway)
MSPAAFYLMLFVLGLVFGSFLSVMIHRIHTGKGGIIFGTSQCPHCKKKLGPAELIPVFSYLIQGGKCKKCKKMISWHYPTLELSAGLLFLAMGLVGLAPLPLYLFYGLVLIFIFFYDILYLEIPDHIMFPAIIVAFFAAFLPETLDIKDALIGAAILLIFFAAQILLSKGKWLGGGDLRIGAFMGLILGWQLTLLATFSSYIIGSVISVGLLASGQVSRKTMIAFGPFLVLGTLVALFYGPQLIDWYLKLTYLV